jgi:hypothetical protein
MNKLTVQECRDILGASALDRTDEQVQRLRDSLTEIASMMYDEVARQAQLDPENVRWTGYAAENPSDACPAGEDDGFHDGPNLLNFDDERVQ